MTDTAALRARMTEAMAVVDKGKTDLAAVVADAIFAAATLENEAESIEEIKEELGRARDALAAQLDRFVEAAEDAHRRARHTAQFALCPNPICRELEAHLHRERKDLAG